MKLKKGIMNKVLIIILPLLISFSLHGQIDGYASGSIQIARNKKSFADDPLTWKTSYYNSFRIGPMFSKTFILGFEYSSIIYRWTDRVSIVDVIFSDDDDEPSPPTVGEKINNYKLFMQVYPFKEVDFFFSGAFGYSNFINFRIPDSKKYGTALSLHMGFETNHNVGFIFSYYKGNLKRLDTRYAFISYNVGIIVTTGRNTQQSE